MRVDIFNYRSPGKTRVVVRTVDKLPAVLVYSKRTGSWYFRRLGIIGTKWGPYDSKAAAAAAAQGQGYEVEPHRVETEDSALDHYYMYKRYDYGIAVMEGAGVNGGQWAVKYGPGDYDEFNSKEAAVSRAEREVADIKETRLLRLAGKDASYQSLGFTRSALMQESMGYLRDRLRQWKADLRAEEWEGDPSLEDIRALKADIRMLESVIAAKEAGRDSADAYPMEAKREGDYWIVKYHIGLGTEELKFPAGANETKEDALRYARRKLEQMSKDASRFSAGLGSRKGGAFRCISCGKLTRETGHEESNFELCKKCLFREYMNNAESDYGKNSPEYKEAKRNYEQVKDAIGSIDEKDSLVSEFLSTLSEELLGDSAKDAGGFREGARVRINSGMINGGKIGTIVEHSPSSLDIWTVRFKNGESAYVFESDMKVVGGGDTACTHEADCDCGCGGAYDAGGVITLRRKSNQLGGEYEVVSVPGKTDLTFVGNSIYMDELAAFKRDAQAKGFTVKVTGYFGDAAGDLTKDRINYLRRLGRSIATGQWAPGGGPGDTMIEKIRSYCWSQGWDREETGHVIAGYRDAGGKTNAR